MGSQQTAFEKLYELSSSRYFEHLRVYWEPVLNNPDFKVWSGSTGDKHHYGNGGLVEHVYEVIQLSLTVNSTFDIDKKVNEDLIFLAGLYHDLGKMKDYIFNGSEWVSSSHKKLIHHISRSALDWHAAYLKAEQDVNNPVSESEFEDVLHAILAHHGLKEWGSPVEPITPLAYLLHYCDGISARFDDWNRIHKDVYKNDPVAFALLHVPKATEGSPYASGNQMAWKDNATKLPAEIEYPDTRLPPTHVYPDTTLPPTHEYYYDQDNPSSYYYDPNGRSGIGH